MRIGSGYDVHRLVEDERLVLGGVELSHERGLAGHSDADVLLHAIADAVLGAAALGDLGTLFPDTDAEWEGADSQDLLRRVTARLQTEGFTVHNVDATVLLERPKLRPHVDAMRANIATALSLGRDRVSVKATTTEGLGFVGRGEGVAAKSVCTIRSL
ncbi:MAG: 2-C-methyl-D-erythritol 2,4-cyclodiphosphate synthase [Salinibacter sp.]